MSDNTPQFIMLKNVRLSFPSLFRKAEFDGKETKYEATFILDPVVNKAEIDLLKKAIGGVVADKLKGAKLKSDKLCLKMADDADRPEYVGKWLIKGSSNRMPVVLTAGRQHVTEEGKSPMYSGCFVNAKVSLWGMDNKWGKRVCCELIAIQFFEDGENLDGSYISPDVAADGFEGYDPDDNAGFGEDPGYGEPPADDDDWMH